MDVSKRSCSTVTRQATPAGDNASSSANNSAGGRALVEKHGRAHMAELGRKGAQSVARRYGLRFYSEIAARNKGVRKHRAGDV
jgi:hypothetical protein